MNILMLNDIIKSTNGRFFSVQFIKKNGEVRDMVCRTGVTKFLKGSSKSGQDNNQVTVWDVVNKGYRTVTLDRVKKIKANGKEAIV